MNALIGLRLAVILVACASPATPMPQSPSEYLLDSAAADFHANQPPTGLRHVRFGHVDGRAILCGEVTMPSGHSWVAFSTVQTSGYEQQLGTYAATACADAKIVWDRADLTAALQARLDPQR